MAVYQADKDIQGFWGDGEAGGHVRFGAWCPAPKPVSNLATKKLEITEITNHLFFSLLSQDSEQGQQKLLTYLLEVWAMSKEGFETCNVRAVSPTTCSISHLATLNFTQHFNNPVTRSQDPSAPFQRLIQGWAYWVILYNHQTLAPHAPNYSEGVDWRGRWPQMLATHIFSQLPPALPLVFNLDRDSFLPGPRTALWKVLPARFFLNPIAFHHGKGLRWVVNYLQHSYLFLHFMLKTTSVWYVVCCPSCHRHVLKSWCFSFQWWLHLIAAKEKSPVWQHPKAPLQAKHQLYFSFMALSFPRHLTAFWQVSYLQDAFERGFHSSFCFCHRISFFGGLLRFIYYYLWVFLLFSFDYSFCFLTATFSNLML